jgi:hypothetical protein
MTNSKPSWHPRSNRPGLNLSPNSWNGAAAAIAGVGRPKSDDLSRLCNGLFVPAYVSLKLSAADRSALVRNRLNTFSSIQTPLLSPVRIFFENGLEIRVTGREHLTISAIYHVHPWLVGALPRPSTRNIDIPFLFVEQEDVLGASSHDWAEIGDPGVSHHARLAAINARLNSSLDAVIIDGTMARGVDIVTTEVTITINRPNGLGFFWSVRPFGAENYSKIADTPSPQGLVAESQKALRDAALWTNRCIAGLPLWRRWLLLLAVEFGPAWSLADLVRTHLTDAVRKIITRRRR